MMTQPARPNLPPSGRRSTLRKSTKPNPWPAVRAAGASSQLGIAPRPVAEDGVCDRGDERREDERPAKRIRSATAPDMSVVAVAMNPSWKRKKAARKALSLSNRKDDEPTIPPSPEPNIKPKPKSQKSRSGDEGKFAKFLIATLIEFFELIRPLSRAVNFACMNKTSARRSAATRCPGSPGPVHLLSGRVQLAALTYCG